MKNRTSHRPLLPASVCLPAIVLALWLLAATAPTSASDDDPQAAIRRPLDRIVQVLNDPQYKAPEMRAAQREKLWEIGRPMFDFTEISRRAVARHWKNFTEQEKKDFSTVFADFLGDTYLDRIQSEYHNEQIVFLKQIVRGNKALVRTKLVRPDGTEVPIDYRMKKIAGAWKIYDILVENGVSLIKNYRVQFAEILAKESPRQLIQRLEKKLAENRAGKKPAEK